MSDDDERNALRTSLIALGRGDRNALPDLYQRTSAKLYGVCLRILNERSEADDVLQETYVTVWQRASGFDAARGSPIAWLVAIARNKAIDRLRTRRMTTEPIDAADNVRDGNPDPAQALEISDEGRRLNDCLGQLEPNQRAAIVGAFLDGATYEQMAARSDVPLGTMKSMIRRSLLKLRGCLDS